jgi:hypothetical protein
VRSASYVDRYGNRLPNVERGWSLPYCDLGVVGEVLTGLIVNANNALQRYLTTSRETAADRGRRLLVRPRNSVTHMRPLMAPWAVGE